MGGFGPFLILALISGFINADPCKDYVPIWMENGLRSSDFNFKDTTIPLCDAYLNNDTWYRFEHDAGNRLIEGPMEPSYCGTQAPIWLNGTHPTDAAEKTAGVCATYSSENNCGWNGTVRIRKCNESGSEYFVYLLAVPPGCPLAYCVDAASRKQCIPPLLWNQDEFKCNEPVTVSPTLRPYSGWSPWGPWSTCEKHCDYGLQFRQRKCGQLPCKGDPTSAQLCALSNCEELSEDKGKGIVLRLKNLNLNTEQDTMTEVLKKKSTIKNTMRREINKICSRNSSLCCRFQIESISSELVEYVGSKYIYVAKGYPKKKLDGTVDFKIIARLNKASCSRVRQAREADPEVISLEVMTMAAENSAPDIKDIGLNVVAERYTDTETSSPCPAVTSSIPIVICGIFLAMIVAGTRRTC